MNEDIRTDSLGRTFRKNVRGDTAEQLELAALDAARAFFGADLRMQIIKNYKVSVVVNNDPRKAEGAYSADLTVRVIEEP